MSSFTNYVIRRIALIPVSIFFLITVIFVLLRVIPGANPVELLNDQLGAALVQKITDELGLNKPILDQYFDFLSRIILHFDFGTSINTRTPILQEIVPKFMATVEVTVFASIIGIPLGILIGVTSGKHRGTNKDQLLRIYTIAVYSVPIFWFGTWLQVIFAKILKKNYGQIFAWIPSSTRTSSNIQPNINTVTGIYSIDTLLFTGPSGWQGIFMYFILILTIGFAILFVVNYIEEPTSENLLKIIKTMIIGIISLFLNFESFNFSLELIFSFMIIVGFSLFILQARSQKRKGNPLNNLTISLYTLYFIVNIVLLAFFSTFIDFFGNYTFFIRIFIFLTSFILLLLPNRFTIDHAQKYKKYILNSALFLMILPLITYFDQAWFILRRPDGVIISEANRYSGVYILDQLFFNHIPSYFISLVTVIIFVIFLAGYFFIINKKKSILERNKVLKISIVFLFSIICQLSLSLETTRNLLYSLTDGYYPSIFLLILSVSYFVWLIAFHVLDESEKQIIKKLLQVFIVLIIAYLILVLNKIWLEFSTVDNTIPSSIHKITGITAIDWFVFSGSPGWDVLYFDIIFAIFVCFMTGYFLYRINTSTILSYNKFWKNLLRILVIILDVFIFSFIYLWLVYDGHSKNDFIYTLLPLTISFFLLLLITIILFENIGKKFSSSNIISYDKKEYRLIQLFISFFVSSILLMILFDTSLNKLFLSPFGPFYDIVFIIIFTLVWIPWVLILINLKKEEKHFAKKTLALGFLIVFVPLLVYFDATLHQLDTITSAVQQTAFSFSAITLFQDILQHLILPSITLGLLLSGVVARIVRTNMVTVMYDQYIDASKARGIQDRRITFNYALKNATVPAIPLIGLQFAILLGGAILTETTYSYQGLGLYLYNALVSKDFPQIQGAVILFAVCVAIVSFVSDIIYATLDKRIRFQ